MNFQVLNNFYAEWLDAKRDFSLFGEKPKQIWIQLRSTCLLHVSQQATRILFRNAYLIVEIYIHLQL